MTTMSQTPLAPVSPQWVSRTNKFTNRMLGAGPDAADRLRKQPAATVERSENAPLGSVGPDEEAAPLGCATWSRGSTLPSWTSAQQSQRRSSRSMVSRPTRFRMRVGHISRRVGSTPRSMAYGYCSSGPLARVVRSNCVYNRLTRWTASGVCEPQCQFHDSGRIIEQWLPTTTMKT